jgi:predicted dehydrogenase
MTGKVRFALLGAGKMGARWASVLSKYDSAFLNAVVDTGSGRAMSLSAQIPGSTATKNITSVLNDKNIDAILITTPHKYLAPITAAALQAGKHVLCEKPAAIRSVDIDKNIRLAKKKKLVYMVGYNHRFHDGFIKARQLYQKGDIGKIIFIRARYGFGGRPGYDKEWRLNKAISGGGHLIDQGVHMIDLALSFMDKIKEVEGFTSDSFWKSGVEDNGFVLLQSQTKITASIHVSLTQWKPLHNFEIYGTKGYLSIEGLGQKYGGGEKLVVGKRSADFTGVVRERVITCNSKADDSLSLEVQEFISAIKQGRQVVPAPVWAYETLRIVEKIYRTNKL